MGVPLFLNGEGMRGGRVHATVADCPFLGEARTAARYRFFSIGDRFPALWDVRAGGAGSSGAGSAEVGVSIVGELYDVPLEVVRDRFVPAEPPELELAVIELADGRASLAVHLRPEVHARGEGMLDISEYGGWHAYRRAAGLSE